MLLHKVDQVQKNTFSVAKIIFCATLHTLVEKKVTCVQLDPRPESSVYLVKFPSTKYFDFSVFQIHKYPTV